MVLTSDGSVYSIGDGAYFLTGAANDTFQPIYSLNTNLASILLNNETITQVHQGLLTPMVITNTGRVLIWGSNQDGALGIGNNNYSVVVQTPQSLNSCGGQTNFTLGSSGDGSFIGSINSCTTNVAVPSSNTTTPTPTPTATSIAQSTTVIPTIVPINASTVSVAIYGFGANNRGQLGDGTTISRATPTLILMNQEFSSITQGHEFTLGITVQGELYAWGRGDEGQLADNSTVYHSQLTPRLVDLSSVLYAALVKCVTGVDTVLCLSNNSVIVGWGNNSNGQISDGTTNLFCQT
jgi:alpha-tubulin suppressor-like RCC1 family protein